MKVGNLVTRKINGPIDMRMQEESGRFGIVLKKKYSQLGVYTVDVFWPKSGKIFSISEKLVEVISESR